MSRAFQLCYITDRRALAPYRTGTGLEPKPLMPRILDAIRAGVDLVQIREKDLPTRELIELVEAAVEGARGTKTRIIVNDRLDVALALGAGGVHLGTQSIPAAAVRACLRRQARVAKNFLVGVSCHSLAEAVAAEQSGANYALLGPIFETPSKAAFGPPLGLETLREVIRRVKIPVLALGGINLDRVKLCLEAGAAGIAGIRLFQECESVEDLVRAVRAQAPPPAPLPSWGGE